MNKRPKTTKKKKTMGNFSLEDELFEFRVNIVWGGRPKDLKAFVLEGNTDPVLKKGVEGLEDDAMGAFIADHNRDFYFLWVKNYKKTDALIHEILHLVQFELESKGIDPGPGLNEISTYLLSYWYRKIVKAIKEDAKT